MLGHSNPLWRILGSIRGAVHPTPAAESVGPRSCRVIGHRGAARVAAENTIDSFRCAMDLGADGIETDICVTKDGRFLLWHDADPSETIALARQTGRECLAYTPDVPALVSKHRRPIRDLSFEEFRENYGYRRRRGGLADLMAGDDAPEVPAATLDDLFAWIDTERRLALVCLDVKLAAKQADAARDLFRIVSTFMAERAAKSPPEIRFLTPDEDVARALLAESEARPHDHRIRVSGDFELPGVLSETRRVGFRDVSMGIGQRLWPGFRDEVMEVVRARDRGDLDSLVVWTLSEPDRLRELVAAGVDGILTDDPPLLRMIVRERANTRPLRGSLDRA